MQNISFSDVPFCIFDDQELIVLLRKTGLLRRACSQPGDHIGLAYIIMPILPAITYFKPLGLTVRLSLANY